MTSIKLENYRILKKLGRGAFGEVFEALDTRKSTACPCALKIVEKTLVIKQKHILNGLENEVKIMRDIKHENIIFLHEAFLTQDNIVFVMELCKGGNLSNYIRLNGLSEEMALMFLLQLSSGLSFLHLHNYIHRDLKPVNILLSPVGRSSGKYVVKIGDFGFAKLLDDESALTRTYCGTPLYMAPEVVRGEVYNTSADVWSLGVVFYEMLVGRNPFSTVTSRAHLKAAHKKPVELPPTIRASTSPRNIMQMMLVTDRHTRSTADNVHIHTKVIIDARQASSPAVAATRMRVPQLVATAAPHGGRSGTATDPRPPGLQQPSSRTRHEPWLLVDAGGVPLTHLTGAPPTLTALRHQQRQQHQLQHQLQQGCLLSGHTMSAVICRAQPTPRVQHQPRKQSQGLYSVIQSLSGAIACVFSAAVSAALPQVESIIETTRARAASAILIATSQDNSSDCNSSCTMRRTVSGSFHSTAGDMPVHPAFHTSISGSGSGSSELQNDRQCDPFSLGTTRGGGNDDNDSEDENEIVEGNFVMV